MYNTSELYSLGQPVFIERMTRKKETAPCIAHYHDIYEMYYLVEGNRDYLIADEIFNLTADCVALIAPGIIHMTRGGHYERILVQFEASFLKKFFNEESLSSIFACFKHNFIRIPQIKQEEIKYLFSKIHKEYVSGDLAVTPLRLAELMLSLESCVNECDQSKETQKFSDDNIAAILKYINDNFSSIESISQIADHFYLNKFYLCHMFKTNVGSTLITYLNNIKISHAIQLIKSTDKNMTDIALECGFNSSVHFCNMFKKFVNMSPSEYKKIQTKLK